MPAPDERCPNCGYDLRGFITLDAFICPECGKATSARDIRAILRQRIRKQARLCRFAWWAAVALAAISAAVFVAIPGLFLVVLLLSWASGVFASFAIASQQRHTFGWFRYPAAVLIALGWIVVSGIGATMVGVSISSFV